MVKLADFAAINYQHSTIINFAASTNTAVP